MIRPVLIAFLFAGIALPSGAQPYVRVPSTPPVPILLDGRLDDDEWRDAQEVVLSDSMYLVVKESDGHVFLGIRTPGQAPRPIDLYLETGDGSIYNLHASMSIGERSFRDTLWTDDTPAWIWGNHVDWIANEAKLDARQPDSLVWKDRLFPAEGVEFQIRRSRFGGDHWRLRIDVGVFPGSHGPVTYPLGATRNSDTWAIFCFDGDGECPAS